MFLSRVRRRANGQGSVAFDVDVNFSFFVTGEFFCLPFAVVFRGG